MAAAPGSPLTNSTTFIPKATYVPLTVTSTAAAATGTGLSKTAFLRSLNLQQGDTAAVQAGLAVANTVADAAPDSASIYSLLKPFEGMPLPAQLPSPASFADVSIDALVAFGNALSALRIKAVAALEPDDVTGGIAINLLNTALLATRRFRDNSGLPPIGMLNLERLEMTPAGIQRGGLLATIPLAPQERTSVVQQEWSVVSQDYATIVTDTLENYSETGVTENTQLAQAATSQVAHSNQLNVNASASGGIGFVSGSASASSVSQDQNSASATDSRTHALQTTQQASSRVTQSHKTSFSISTTTGQSESSTRALYNPSETDAMRVDYFSVMRQWYVALYRYGLRLTYDVTVPQPAAAMRESYRQLAILQQQANQQLPPLPQPVDINHGNYLQYAGKYDAQVTAPPLDQTIQVTAPISVANPSPGSEAPTAVSFPVPVPAGY